MVLKEFKRRGIGSELFNRLVSKYPNVRQKVLLTEETTETRRFYESKGFKEATKGLISFVRFD
ncbi:GNAT family N-acetyltransferase [Proteinivorax tanatarense]|uniref:GNAT family N-acetyltransferase n=1 Tax=Proteinivorax tanatarense TaxID=1260629 RepID=A0AAU7VS30_9FIRM